MRNEELTSMETIKIHDASEAVTWRSFVIVGREIETMIVSRVLIKAASDRQSITGRKLRFCAGILVFGIGQGVRMIGMMNCMRAGRENSCLSCLSP